MLDTREGQRIQTFFSFAPPYVGVLNDPVRVRDGNVLGRWTRKISGRSDIALQVYYDGVGHLGFAAHESRNTVDFDFQHHFAATRHDIVWGLGYRLTTDDFTPGYAVAFNPASRTDNLLSGFFQDDIQLTTSTQLTIGSKLEHNSYTGLEADPNVRVLWSPNDRNAFWGAISRAIRQPSRADENLQVNSAAFPGPGGLLNLVTVFGNPKFYAEELLAYEAGYRAQASRRVSLDLATFYNVYHNLKTTEPGTPFLEMTPAPPRLVIPAFIANKMRGQTYGTEVSANWTVTSRWKLTSGYSWLNMNLYLDPSSRDTLGTPGSPNPYSPAAAGCSPRHQFQVRSYLNLPRNVDFDTAFYYVDRLPALQVPSYTRVDARLGWRVGESTELSVVGQNLLDPRHLEFGNIDSVLPTKPRAACLQS